MFKRLSIILLTAISLCMAEVSEPVRAYIPFQLEGLHERYKADGYGKYAYAPATVYFNGAFHQFYCSSGQGTDNFFNPEDNVRRYNSKDHIRYRSSKDGVNWSAPRVVMTVSMDGSETCACDPSVVYGDDGYWYMLYTSGMEGYHETVVLLARSNYIQGPYFRYMDNQKWENETGHSDNPKVMLGTTDKVGTYGVGQQTVVKDPGKNGIFRVWYVDANRNFRYKNVKKLTDLKYESHTEAKYYDANGKLISFGNPWIYVMGEVRLNIDQSKNRGETYFEMWCPVGYFLYETRIAKFWSTNGTAWHLETNDLLDVPQTYHYSYIHNIGVSGDMYGRISGDKYLISFAAPSPDWTDDPKKALNAIGYNVDGEFIRREWVNDLGYDCAGMDWKKCFSNNMYVWGAELMDKGPWGGFNIVSHRNGVKKDEKDSRCEEVKEGEFCEENGRFYKICKDGKKCEVCPKADMDGCKNEDMGGNWSMWQVLVGGDWFTNTINYDPNGTIFPEGPGVNSYAQLDYFTGDYDGDGIADLGAVNRKKTPNTWFIRSGRTGEYLYRNEVLIENMDKNYEIIAGDYDGDGKTDIGAVNKATGQWFIRSSEEGNRMGIGSSPSWSNWIPWGWTWGGMDASFKIVVGDYDGDGKADRAIYKAPYWYIISSTVDDYAVADGFTNVYGVSIPFGWYWVWNDEPRVAPTYMDEYDVVLPGDLDGDGITDQVVYESEYGLWSALSSRSGNPVKWHCGRGCTENQWFSRWSLFRVGFFSISENTKPFVGDYDGDGVDDLVQVDFSDGRWHIYRSSDHIAAFFDDNSALWKKFADAKRPEVLVGDFDGDGRADRAFADKQTHKFYVISSRKKDWGVEGINVEIKSAFENNASKSWSYFAKSAAEKPIEEPKAAPVVSKAPSMNVAVDGKKVTVTNVEYGSKVAVFDMLGKSVLEAPAGMNAATFEVPTYGKYIVRAGAQSRVIMVK